MFGAAASGVLAANQRSSLTGYAGSWSGLSTLCAFVACSVGETGPVYHYVKNKVVSQVY